MLDALFVPQQPEEVSDGREKAESARAVPDVPALSLDVPRDRAQDLVQEDGHGLGSAAPQELEVVRLLPGHALRQEPDGGPGSTRTPTRLRNGTDLRQRNADQLVLGERLLPTLVAKARDAVAIPQPEPDDVLRCQAQNI